MDIDLGDELETAFKLGLSSGMDEMKQVAVGLSSGGYSLAQLAAMGHPYATRHVSGASVWKLRMPNEYVNPSVPMLDPAIINTHSPSGFISFWKVDPMITTSEGITASLINASPVADYLAGKNRPRSKMVRRPIDDELEALGEPLIESHIESALAAFERRDIVL